MATNSNILWKTVTLEGVTDDGGIIKLTATVESTALAEVGSHAFNSTGIETSDDLDELIQDDASLQANVRATGVEYVVSYFRRSPTPEPMDRDDEAEETGRRR